VASFRVRSRLIEGRNHEMDDDPITEELRTDALEREREERRRAQEADRDEETQAHRRRAEKAEYLRRKLDERAKSERGG